MGAIARPLVQRAVHLVLMTQIMFALQPPEGEIQLLEIGSVALMVVSLGHG